VNVQELARAIRKQHGFTKAECRRILETVLEAIREKVKAGDVVRLRNFGSFRKGKSRGKDHVEFRTSKNFFK